MSQTIIDTTLYQLIVGMGILACVLGIMLSVYSIYTLRNYKAPKKTMDVPYVFTGLFTVALIVLAILVILAMNIACAEITIPNVGGPDDIAAVCSRL